MERYSVGLLIRHPHTSPNEITRALGLTPRHFWRRDDPRRTPDGTDLGGTYPDTMWRSVTRKHGSRRFFDGARDLVNDLRLHRDFLTRLVSEGGRVTLIVNLPGDVNMGDVLEPAILQLMAELGIELGVEVFPKMR